MNPWDVLTWTAVVSLSVLIAGLCLSLTIIMVNTARKSK